MSKQRTTSITPAVLLIVAPLLGGCFPRPTGPTPVPDISAIEVHEQTQSIHLPSRGSRRDAKAALSPLVDALGEPGQVHVTIQPHGQPLAPRRVDELTAALASLGIRLGNIVVAPPTDGAEDGVTVALARSTASPPDCDSLMSPSSTTYRKQRPQFAFGCANLHNLSQMLDDPRDLVQPQPYAGPWGARESGAVRRYDDNAGAPLQNGSSQSSSMSTSSSSSSGK